MSCSKCHQPYVAATIGLDHVVWLAVAPFAARLCPLHCSIGQR